MREQRAPRALPEQPAATAVDNARDNSAPQSSGDPLIAQERMDLTFRELVEAAPYGMLVIDAANTIVLTNRRLGELFGYGPGELIGRPLDTLIPGRYQARHGSLVASYLSAPSLRPMGPGRDVTGQHRDGTEFPIEIGLNPLHWDGKAVTLAGITDISARKKMELELRQANAHLEEFTYVASHDLRSPLRGISDLIEWISEDLEAGASAKVQHNLERVKVRVERMETIIEDLLTYARAGRASTDLVPVEPRALIEGVLELQPIPSGLKVSLEVEAGLFKAARTPLETVLRNLIGNAVKHHDREQGTIDIRVTEDDSCCVFSVADDGPGIPSNAQERVFKLFQTVSASQRQGSGIGLALASRLVECHGGQIALESSDGKRGVTFTVRWPRFQRRVLDD